MTAKGQLATNRNPSVDGSSAPKAVIPSTGLELEDSTHTGRSLRPAPPLIRF